jgi:CheY-like chemotaxis protein/PAS domain-containing protein
MTISIEKDVRVHAILRELCRVVEGAEAVLFEREPETGIYAPAGATHDRSPARVSTANLFPDGVLARLTVARRGVRIADVLSPENAVPIDEAIAPIVDHRALIGLPVLDRGASAGFVLIGAPALATLDDRAEDALALALVALGGLLSIRREAAGQRDRLAILRLERDDAEATLAAVLEGIADGIVVADAEGRVLDANPAFRDRFGLTDDGLADVAFESADDSETVAVLRLPGPDGATRVPLVRRTLRVAGRDLVLGIVPAALAAEAAAPGPPTADAPTAAVAEAAPPEVAGDLPGLLSAIRGHASLALAQVPADHAIRGHLREIDLAAREIGRRVRAAAGESREAPPAPTPIYPEVTDVNRIVHRVMDALGRTGEPGGSVLAHLAPSLPPVSVDAAALTDGVLALADALAQTLGEGAPLTLRTAAVEIGPEEADATGGVRGTYVRVQIGGNGGALASDALLAPAATTLRRAVDAAGGRIVASPRGERSGIEILLPTIAARAPWVEEPMDWGRPGDARAADALAAPAPAALAPAAAPASARPVVRPAGWTGERPAGAVRAGKGTVLVVDDEELMKTLAERVLQDAGFDVLTASDGREAIGVLERHARDVDLVLLDLILPGMSGTETFRRVREIRPDVKVVLTSGYQRDDVPPELADPARMGFLHKPYEVGDLVEAVARIIDKD